MIAPAEDSGLFSAIAGLPLHPLVVHLAVVVLPASALALVGLVLVPRWRARYATLTVAAALLGTAGAFAAKESGEALADRVGLPAEHAEWGDRLFLVAVVYAVVTVVWFVLHRRQARQTVAADIGRDSRDDRDGRDGRATIPDRRARPTGILSAVNAVAGILAVAVLALTVVVGHTGATAVWGDTPAASTSKGDDEGAAAPDAPSGTATAGTAGTATAGSTATGSTTAGSATSSGTRTGSPARPKRAASVAHTYTLAQVHRHGDRSSCWVAVDGSVYDLNRWVGRHPGGPEAILGICGSDATSAFHAQHGQQRRPAAELATFRIGALR